MTKISEELAAKIDAETGGALSALKKESPPARIAMALFIIAGIHAKKPKLSDDQFFDLFMAGMQAHRLVSAHDFMLSVFLGDDSATEDMMKNGISAVTITLMMLESAKASNAANEQFSNLCEMLKD